jgi:anaerobic ribonucleoside-triphosphate reductase activating protein
VTRHWGRNQLDEIRFARIIERTRVLGPGPRAVLVVQGCELRCRGCTVPETHRLDGGNAISITDLARRLLAIEGLEGLTLTGGEPFLQAGTLTALIDVLRVERPGLSTMSYSGYRLEWLRAKGSPEQRVLLDRLDLLIDGPYIERLHAPLLWRGSENQRIHTLSARHRGELGSIPDTSAGMEWQFGRRRRMEWVGVPPVRGFARRLATPAAARSAETRRRRERE